ncbi:MAG: hypothetical protein AAGB22_15050, partial [Bacteroidota bacterium]
MAALIPRITLFFLLLGALPFTANAKEYIVALSQTTVDVLDRQHYVQEVIMSPEVGTTIGFVQKGLGNTRVPAFLEGEVPRTLHRFFQRLLPDAGAEPLIVRVNRLRISEITYFAKELAYCEVSLDIMARRDGQLVLLYRTGHTRTVKGMDVTSGHANNLAQALVACFREFSARVQEGRLLNVPLAHPDSAHANLVPVADWLTEEEHNAGLFATYTDFRDGRIDTVTTFTTTESVNEHGITTYKVKVKDSRAKRKPWGFTDGLYAYVRLDKEY